ncbi:MAG: RecQ family ATP-dependent DNA helicase [Candidatus Moranbacteria bacterium]|nr:RecQ family ATP-dependent DNA helicase [bacterium]MDP1834147.1 RecQ family ATP-dependent DNA helicase [Candidatus Moranbacteria bacterium]
MLEKNLEKYFKFPEFRAGQKEIIESIMNGEDVVALMPTGGGKSLCYQLPAILSEKITIVISPLIALMKDQVDSLAARGIAATFINSSLDAQEIGRRLADLRAGKIKILYIAPERFASGEFRSAFSDLDIALFAVDEAHCVSQWGHDFRPDYLAIGQYIKTLKKRPSVAAFTATATPEVKDDIIARLDLREPKVFIRGFDRPNIRFFAQCDLKPTQRLEEVVRIVKSLKNAGSGIVYAISRKDTEAIAQYLKKNGITARAYHAGMKAGEREAIQDDFMENRFKVIVATVAFGMGVDKADIRFVIHAGMPGSLEGYYQEAGRAGRDGELAYCVLLHSKRDVTTHKYFIRLDKQNMLAQGKGWQETNQVLDIKYDRLEGILNYATAKSCRRRIILEYFQDPDLESHQENCKGCDVCLNWKNTELKKTARGAARAIRGKDGLSDTILATVDFYRQDYAPEQIAKIRSLGVSTVFNHLVLWYLAGGELAIEKFVTAEEERQILRALPAAGSAHFLSAIKAQLPEAISYEQIRLVIAKRQKTKMEKVC